MGISRRCRYVIGGYEMIAAGSSAAEEIRTLAAAAATEADY